MATHTTMKKAPCAAKLTWAQIEKIRQEHQAAQMEIMRLESQYSMKGIARRYGVARQTIEKIINNKTWQREPKRGTYD